MMNEGNNTVNIVVNPNKLGEGSSLIDEGERGRLYSIKTFNGKAGLQQWGYQQPHENNSIESEDR